MQAQGIHKASENGRGKGGKRAEETDEAEQQNGNRVPRSRRSITVVLGHFAGRQEWETCAEHPHLLQEQTRETVTDIQRYRRYRYQEARKRGGQEGTRQAERRGI